MTELKRGDVVFVEVGNGIGVEEFHQRHGIVMKKGGFAPKIAIDHK